MEEKGSKRAIKYQGSVRERERERVSERERERERRFIENQEDE